MPNTREQNFLNTLLQVLEYDNDNFPNYKTLLGILRYSEIKFSDTGGYTRKYLQYFEVITIRVPVFSIKIIKNLEEEVTELIKYTYEESDKYDLYSVEIKPKIIKSQIDEVKEHEPHFNNIKKEIIDCIRNAKYFIWVAVACFTDNDIYLELIDKKNKGLNIRVILSDEPSNISMINNLRKENIDLTVFPNYGHNGYNRLHSKFCIIDFEIVLHGSFNWTLTAANNEESLDIAYDKDFARKFSDNFLELYNDKNS